MCWPKMIHQWSIRTWNENNIEYLFIFFIKNTERTWLIVQKSGAHLYMQEPLIQLHAPSVPQGTTRHVFHAGSSTDTTWLNSSPNFKNRTKQWKKHFHSMGLTIIKDWPGAGERTQQSGFVCCQARELGSVTGTTQFPEHCQDHWVGNKPWAWKKKKRQTKISNNTKKSETLHTIDVSRSIMFLW